MRPDQTFPAPQTAEFSLTSEGFGLAECYGCGSDNGVLIFRARAITDTKHASSTSIALCLNCRTAAAGVLIAGEGAFISRASRPALREEK